MTIIFDLDGTIADIRHRLHLVSSEPKQWDEFNKLCIYDQPNSNVISVLNDLKDVGNEIIILTGRSSVVKPQTLEWLNKYDVHYDEIYMRGRDDYTSDVELKRKWLIRYGKSRIVCVFDDRQGVVNMWREEGITCFQVLIKDAELD